MKIITFISTAFIVLLSACGTTQHISESTTTLYDTKWSLKKIYSDAGVQDVSTRAFIKFDEIKKSAGGNGSCNTFGSSITIHDKEVIFKNIFSTKMYCEDVQQTEDAFLKLLGRVNKFEVKAKHLLLYEDEKIVLEFEAP